MLIYFDFWFSGPLSPKLSNADFEENEGSGENEGNSGKGERFYLIRETNDIDNKTYGFGSLRAISIIILVYTLNL